MGRGREHVLRGERPASERGGLIRGTGRELASDVRRRLCLCPANNKLKMAIITLNGEN